MKMKKCLSLVLAAAMTFTLASCGGNGGSGGGEGGESKVSLNVSVPDADNSYIYMLQLRSSRAAWKSTQTAALN